MNDPIVPMQPPVLKPVERVAANVQVYEQIRRALMSGAYAPGEALSTRQIADSLCVSQTPIREAFHRLVAERALENRPNRTIGLPVLALAEFNDLTDMRLHLEGLASEKAAVRRSHEDCSKLQELVDAMDGNRASDDPYLDLNRQFHFTLYAAAQSPTLVQMIDQLWLRVGPLLNWSAKRQSNIQRSSVWHGQALAAVVEKDPAGAKHAMTMDISEAAEIVRADLERQSSPVPSPPKKQRLAG